MAVAGEARRAGLQAPMTMAADRWSCRDKAAVESSALEIAKAKGASVQCC